MDVYPTRELHTSEGSATARRLGRELLAGCVVVFLLFGPYLSQFMRVGTHVEDMLRGRNAFWFLWRPVDLPILLSSMLAIVVVAMIIREALLWTGRPLPVKLFDHAFVVTLGAGLLANIWFHTQRPEGYRIGQFGMEMQTAWLLLFGITGYSLASGKDWLVRGSKRACQVISPAMLIVVYQLYGLPTLDRRMDPLTPAAAPKPEPAVVPAAQVQGSDAPVFLFIFDEWSYRRTYEAGKVRNHLAHLADLSRHATTFHQAHAPGGKTITSIPAILRGTPDLPELTHLAPGFLRDGRFIEADRYPSIFTRAGCTDYRKIMVQWGSAVSLWVADELDVTRAYSCYPTGEGWSDQAALHIYNAAFFWTDPWTIFAYEKLKSRALDAYHPRVYRQMRDDAGRIIRGQPARTFAIIHYPLPHPPYLVDEEGNYRGRDPKAHLTANAEGYERNLAYLDRIIGGIVNDLRDTGRFDESLLILTSDHTWRQDPAVSNPSPEELSHVPLIIKLPGQTEPREITDDFRTYRLGEFIAQALENKPRPQPLASRLP